MDDELWTPMELRAIEKGRLLEVREMVARVLCARFGDSPDKNSQVLSAIEQVTDRNVLGKLHDCAVTASSREEFDRAIAERLAAGA